MCKCSQWATEKQVMRAKTVTPVLREGSHFQWSATAALNDSNPPKQQSARDKSFSTIRLSEWLCVNRSSTSRSRSNARGLSVIFFCIWKRAVVCDYLSCVETVVDVLWCALDRDSVLRNRNIFFIFIQWNILLSLKIWRKIFCCCWNCGTFPAKLTCQLPVYVHLILLTWVFRWTVAWFHKLWTLVSITNIVFMLFFHKDV